MNTLDHLKPIISHLCENVSHFHLLKSVAVISVATFTVPNYFTQSFYVNRLLSLSISLSVSNLIKAVTQGQLRGFAEFFA